MSKMKVKMRHALAGEGLSLKPGDIHTGDAAELARWCENGIAEAIKGGEKRKATSRGAAKAEKAVPAQVDIDDDAGK